MALKKPNRLQYPIYTKEGKEKYAKDMRAYKKAEAEAKRKAEANKKPAVKKLAAKKPVAKKPVAKKPVAKKPVAKKPVAKKPVTKKPATKKPAAKQPAKRKPFDPPKRGRGRPKGSKNAPKRKPFDSVDKSQQKTPKGNKSLKIAGDGAKQTGRFLKDTGKQIYDAGKKGVGKLQTKLAAKDQTPQQAVPEGKSKGAKFAKKVNQKIGNYAKRVYNKAALDTFKFKTVMDDPSKRKINRSGVKRGIGAGAALTIGNALVNRLTKPKGMSNKEWSDFKAKKEQEGVEKRRKLIKKGYDFYGKRLKKVSSDLTGKKYDSSTTNNKSNNKKNDKKNVLKMKRTDRSNRNNTNKDYRATTATKDQNIKLGEFREDPNKNRQLQLENQNQKKKKKKITYDRVTAKNKNKFSNQHTNNNSSSSSTNVKRGKSSIEDKNRARFGDAHVNKLKNKQRDFKLLKKKKMTKKEFIRRYPKSITAQRAAGLR